MKPTGGETGSRFGSRSRERRAALISLSILVGLLVSLILYQRFMMQDQPVPNQPDVDRKHENGTVVDLQTDAPENGIPVVSATDPVRLRPPMAGERRILRSFRSVDEAYGDFRFYGGLAYEAAPGDSVIASAAGTIVAVEEHPLDGKILVVDHGGGLRTRYAGLGSVNVAPGGTVTQGEAMAQVGKPGPARANLGSHLVFQVLLHGVPADPTDYFQK